MRLRDALQLKPGDEVWAPRVGLLHAATVIKLDPHDDPRIQLLVHVDYKGPLVLNYKLLRRTE